MTHGVLIRRLSRLAADRRGVSALEFALIAPILIVMFFGLTELSAAITVQRRVGHATSEIGDLVAQYSTIASSQVSDAADAAGWVLSPYVATAPTFQLRMTSIMVDSSSSHTPRVNWSCVPSTQAGLTALTAGTAVTMPTDANGNSLLLGTTAGASVIRTEATYVYTPGQYTASNTYTVLNSGTPITFTKTLYNAPRQSAQVVLQAGSTTTTSSISPWSSSSSAVAYTYTSSNAAPSLSCSYQKN